MGPHVAVVISSYRRPLLLVRCLDALLRQETGDLHFEILVCDDGPDESTRRVACCFAARAAAQGLRLTYIPMTGSQGPAAARNRGWRAARAPGIAFTGDDTVPDRGWIATGFEALLRSRAWAVAGRIDVPLAGARIDQALDAAGLREAELASANCFVLRAALERIGGFDERYTSAWREGSDLQFSILRAGGRVVRAPGARVVRPVRPGPWGASVSHARKSHFDALLYKKHAELCRARIARTPPWNYYAIVASLLLAAGAFITSHPALGLLAILFWLALTLGFAATRLRPTSRRTSRVAFL